MLRTKRFSCAVWAVLAVSASAWAQDEPKKSAEDSLFQDLPVVEAAVLRKQTLKEAPANVTIITAADRLRDGLGESHIVKAIVDLAHALRLVVIAEGIETESQFETIKDFGCEFGQGYLFARPLSPAAFERLFRTRG